MLIPQPQTLLKIARFSILVRGPILWNNFLSNNKKGIDHFLLFKQKAKEKKMELSTAANLSQ